MKLFPAMFAVAAALTFGMTSCSDTTTDEGGQEQKNGNERYISVNIQNTLSTQAVAGAKANFQTRADGGYSSGTEAEGTISNVRFYFFNQDGSPYTLTNSTPAGVNFLDYDVDSTTPADGTNTVERYTNTMVVINGVSGEAPDYMIAVANPGALTNPSNTSTSNTPVLDQSSLSRDQLTRVTMQTQTFRDSTNGNFLMTNSVYGDASGTYRCATYALDNVATSRAAAIANPVDIYVERLAAKVTVSHPTTGTEGERWSQQTINGESRTTYHIGYYKYNDERDSVDVYAVVRGWGLADEQRLGKLFKDITGYEDATTGWRANLGFTPWNVAEYHRCFWEISPTFNATRNDNPIDYQFSTYNKNFTNVSNSDTDIAYTMPNTPISASNNEDVNRNTSRTERTKVLLAVNLMYRDASGNWQNAEISTYRGQEYLGEDAVKTQILNDVRGHLIKKTSTGWSELDADDIDMYTPSGSASQRSYQVIPNLNYMNDYAIASIDTASANTPVTDYPDANEFLQRYANTAEVRKDGMAYYYTAIHHLAPDDTSLGSFAVVRNHWYQVNITGLTGWGTPVYDPNQVIVPITPTDEETFLAARINVLQWHVVSNDYYIDGTTKQ